MGLVAAAALIERGGASEWGERGGAGVSGRGRVINGFMLLEDKKSKIEGNNTAKFLQVKAVVRFESILV